VAPIEVVYILGMATNQRYVMSYNRGPFVLTQQTTVLQRRMEASVRERLTLMLLCKHNCSTAELLPLTLTLRIAGE
jgi:hypothetical protein